MKRKKIIYIGGVPYRNWYEKLPIMSDKEEDELHKKILKLRERMNNGITIVEKAQKN